MTSGTSPAKPKRAPLAPGERLPVNARRKKVPPEKRKRVVTACNKCNVRRVKCDGGQPCAPCRKAKLPCVYPPPEDKVALKSGYEQLRVKDKEHEKHHAKLKRQLADRDMQLADRDRQLADERRRNTELVRQILGNYAVSGSAKSHAVQPQPLLSDSPTDFATQAFPMSPVLNGGESSAGRLLQDDSGAKRFMGQTSGATFLDDLKHFIRSMVDLVRVPSPGRDYEFLQSIGRYQTFDSRPLPNPTVDEKWLPSDRDMVVMLKDLRSYIQEGGDHVFPSGGIYYWGDLCKLPSKPANPTGLIHVDTIDSFRHLAFYHVCFAVASSINHAAQHSEQHSGKHLTIARKLIPDFWETERFTVDDIQVLALMAFQLIEINRRDAACMCLSKAIDVAKMLGVGRIARDERTTRIFWTLYIMDRWLSVLMGRPPIITDESTKLMSYPNDPPAEHGPMPPHVGLNAHIQLARIGGNIVCETYQEAPRYPTSDYLEGADYALGHLDVWKDELPNELQLTFDPLSADQTRLDTPCCNLHMEQKQLIILVTRPFVLALVKYSVEQRCRGNDFSIEESPLYKYVEGCLQAACENILLAQHAHRSKKYMQAGLHFVFNAAVILLLGRILHVGSGVSDGLHSGGIDYAIQVFRDGSKPGTGYQQDCCRVLQDLKGMTDLYLSQYRAATVPTVNLTIRPMIPSML